MRYWQIRINGKAPHENGAPGKVRLDGIEDEEAAFRWLNNYRTWYPDRQWLLVEVNEVVVEPSARQIRAAVKASLNPHVSEI